MPTIRADLARVQQTSTGCRPHQWEKFLMQVKKFAEPSRRSTSGRTRPALGRLNRTGTRFAFPMIGLRLKATAMKLSRIIVPIDFSPDCEAALAWALDSSPALGASVDLLHVVENPMAAGVWSSAMYTAEVQGLQINLVRDATRRLRDFVPQVAGAPCRVRRHVRVGDPAREIVKFAAERGANLIVMGTLGRTGLSHLMMGSVAEHVSRSATCPVLTVKSNQAYAALQQRRKSTKVPA